MDNAKGYKAFNPGMICRDKQYAENTDYEEVGGTICEKGMMHYCVNPFDVLNFYDLVDESGKFSDLQRSRHLTSRYPDLMENLRRKSCISARS